MKGLNMGTDDSKPVTPKVKYKSFKYRTQLKRIENRTGILDSDGKPPIRFSSPPEFKGEAGLWTPEDLFVSAIDACTMTTFVAFAERESIPIVSYHSDAEGLLEFVDGKYRITHVIVRPKVVVGSADLVNGTRDLFKKTHDNCIVTNSINTTVVIEPDIRAA
jgi:organic hydroperoxide reductase OsmC/OhrA